MFNRVILVLLLLIFSNDVFSATLKGRVISKDFKSENIVGATIKIKNTTLGSISNLNGEFLVKKVPNGKFELSIHSVGYKPITLVKEINNDKTDIDLGTIEMETAETSTGEVVVTATKAEKVYQDIPIKVSVISDKIFKQTASVSLKDGLSFQPGLRVETDCQNCGFSQVRLNGLEGKYSQVLIDGKAIYSSLNGVYGLDQIPSNMIDRVEVIRGGGSSLYGGNAIAGVINIITKAPSENIFKCAVNQAYTNNEKPDNNVQISGSIINDDQNLGLFLFGTNHNRDEWDANGDGYTEIGRLNIKTMGANLFYKPSYLSKISFEYHTVYHEIRGGDSLDLPPHQSNITETTKHNTNVFQLQYEQYIGSTNDKFTVYASHQYTKRNSYYGAGHDLNAYGTTDNQTSAIGAQYSRVQNSFYGDHLFIFGYEYNLDNMDDLAPAYNRIIHQKVYTNGFYLQDDYCATDWLDIVFGARFDKHNLIDNLIFSPRANAMIKPFEDLSLRLSYSTGYRAPQAFDEDLHITQVNGGGMVIRVADDLKPEYSKSLSASIDYVVRFFDLPIGLSLEFFNTNLNDAFILEEQGTDEKGNKLLIRKNGENATVQGFTLEAEFNLNNFNIKAGATVQNSKYDNMVQWSSGDTKNGVAPQYSDKLLRTPDNYGYFTINWIPLSELTLNLSGVITGSMLVPHYAGGLDNNNNLIERDILYKSKTFFELNTKITYKLMKNPNLEISLGMQNILNQYQNDFDRGMNRDAGYIYGPSRPQTVFVGLSTEL